MQSHNADLGSAVDMNFKLSKLADLQLTTKRMESEYKAMAEAMIKANQNPAMGNPYADAHSKDLWSTVDEQFNVLLWQLDEEKTTNLKLVQAATAKVNACNTARHAAYDDPVGGVKVRSTASKAARGVHSSCRTTETAKITTRKTTCEEFVEKSLCDAHDNRYQFFAKANGKDVPTAVLEAVASATVCKNNLAAEVAQSETCDEKQREFEMAFCQYDQKLKDTCDTLDECRTRTEAERAQVITGVEELEKNQKIVYRMVQKVKCYVTAMRGKFKTLSQTDISYCQDQNHAQGAEDALGIEKKAPQPKSPCILTDLAHGAPGDASWSGQEYAGMHAHHDEVYAGSRAAVDKIDAVTNCAVLLA